MKIFKIFIVILGAVSASAVYTSCTKTTPQVGSTQTDFSNASSVQVFDATVKSTRNYIYVDGVPVSGAALAYGAIFPATAFSFKVNAGSRSFTIKDTLATSTQIPITFSETMDAGKSYTIFTYDTITSVKHLTVLNDVIVPKDTSSMLRFANFVYNATAVPNVDVYSYRGGITSPVFKNVATAQATSFIPYASGVTDTLYVYATGTTSPLIIKAAIPSLTPTRSYTAAYSGSFMGTKAIATFATY